MLVVSDVQKAEASADDVDAAVESVALASLVEGCSELPEPFATGSPGCATAGASTCPADAADVAEGIEDALTGCTSADFEASWVPYAAEDAIAVATAADSPATASPASCDVLTLVESDATVAALESATACVTSVVGCCCSSDMVCSWSVLLVAAAGMADEFGSKQIPPGRRIEIAATSETTLKGIHMGKSLDRPGDWATIEVSADEHLETLEKIHAMVDQLTSRGAFLNMAIYETTHHAGGPATFYFSPANSALAKALGAVASATGPIETRRVGIAVHENYAATLFAPSGGTDSAG